jgi:hypothetical protein
MGMAWPDSQGCMRVLLCSTKGFLRRAGLFLPGQAEGRQRSVEALPLAGPPRRWISSQPQRS